MPEERIQKILARAGIASRREAEDLIRQRRVTVNGEVAELGTKADAATDLIRVDGQIVSLKETAPVYIALYKPTGIVSAARAQQQEKRRTVRDLVPVPERLYPVGRLDADSEGLILLTNDGTLTERITHPRYGHRKTYRVLVQGKLDEETLERWRRGVELDDGFTGPADVRLVHREAGTAWLEIVMGEGRKRQIRRTAAVLHLHVNRLIRTRIGALELGEMKPGEWRYLTPEEVALLKRNPARPTTLRRSRVPQQRRKPAESLAPPGSPKRGPRPRRDDEREDRPARKPAARPAKPRRPRKDDADAWTNAPPPGKPAARKPSGPRRDDDRKPAGPRKPSGSRPGRPGGRSRKPGEK